MTYKLLKDSHCRLCMINGHGSDGNCGKKDNIPAKKVWQNMETKKLVTFMADGGECYTMEAVEEEAAHPPDCSCSLCAGQGEM